MELTQNDFRSWLHGCRLLLFIIPIKKCGTGSLIFLKQVSFYQNLPCSSPVPMIWHQKNKMVTKNKEISFGLPLQHFNLDYQKWSSWCWLKIVHIIWTPGSFKKVMVLDYTLFYFNVHIHILYYFTFFFFFFFL